MFELTPEIRARNALKLLEAQPEAQFAIFTDSDSDPESIILTVAIRNVGCSEMRVPRFTALTSIQYMNGERFTLQ